MRTLRRLARSTLVSAAALTALVASASSARADKMATGAPATNFDVADYVTGLGDTTDFQFLPDGRMIITEKGGLAKVRTTTGTIVTAATFDVSTVSEQGLLGVAVDPDFATNKRLFFYYSQADGTGTPPGSALDRHRVVSVTLKDDNTIDLTASLKVLASGLRGPANHDGGGMAIGPDKKLYFGTGDTGCNSNLPPEPIKPPTNYFATCLTNGNGKIHRINLDGTIPDDNPLKGLTAVTKCGEGNACGAEGTAISAATGLPRDSIWGWGFRNPWRFWFDPKTDKLWVGDVGEITYEEIDIVQKGRHHGWPWREGFHGNPVTKCNDVTPGGDCIEPLYECSHSGTTATEDGDCQSITGGLIVDSCSFPLPFRGSYVFGDSSKGTMWTLDVNATRDGFVPKSRKSFAAITGAPVSIHTGPDGAIYVAVDPGHIARIAPKTAATCDGTDGGPTDATPLADTGGDTAPLPDTGTSGGDGSPGPDASSDASSDGSAGDDSGSGDAPSDSSGGCGCRVTSEPTSSSFAVLGAGAALMVLAARRRRRS